MQVNRKRTLFETSTPLQVRIFLRAFFMVAEIIGIQKAKGKGSLKAKPFFPSP
jgi:hypothetical protein